MSDLVNRQWIYKERPADRLTAEHFAWRSEVAVSAPPADHVLVRVQMLSVDPSQRTWMAGPSYRPMLQPGSVMASYGVGTVIASNAPGFSPGDRVEGDIGWQDYATVPADTLRVRSAAAPIEHVVGALGITGVTAYVGLFDIGRPVAGETVLVSGAAGAVGTVVVQLAKLAGCRVVGIAGGAEKCRRLQGLGVDATVDYRAGDLRGQIKQACPDGIDVYFDNVAGEILETTLPSMKPRGRIVCCGAISLYDQARAPAGPKGVPALLVAKRLRMEGFVVLDHPVRRVDAERALETMIADGRLTAAVQIVQSLEHAPQALLDLLAGRNFGKMMVRVAD